MQGSICHFFEIFSSYLSMNHKYGVIMSLKTIFGLLCVLFFLSCTSEYLEVEPSSWAEVREQGEGVIELAYVPSEGFSYKDEGGRLTGVTIELIRDFVEFVNREYDVNVILRTQAIGSFTEFYNYVKESDSGVFGVANVTITEQRREELQFSPAYMTNIATLITHLDIEEISVFEEIPERFAGLDALAFEGTLHEVRLRQIIEDWNPEAGIEFAHSNGEIIERTSEGNRYFAYVDIYNYWRAVERGEPLRRHAAGDEASEQFGVISPVTSDWGEVMNQFFESDGGYIQSGRFRSLMREHLGEELAELLINEK